MKRITNGLAYVSGGSVREISDLLYSDHRVWFVNVVTDSDGEDNLELIPADHVDFGDIEEIIDSDDFLGYMVM